MKHLTSILDAVASELQSKGLSKLATDVHTVSSTLSAGHHQHGKDAWKDLSDTLAYLKEPCEYLLEDVRAHADPESMYIMTCLEKALSELKAAADHVKKLESKGGHPGEDTDALGDLFGGTTTMHRQAQ